MPAVSVSPVVFVSEIAGAAVAVRVTASVSVTAGPDGGVPVTEALLVRDPASTSAWVAVYSNVQDVVADGANVIGSHVPTTAAPARPSLIWTLVNVTLPVFSASRV